MTLKTFAPLPNNDTGLPLREIFNREAAQAVKDFPQLDGRFVFIDAPDNIAIVDHLDRRALGISDRELRSILSEVKESAVRAGSSMSTKLGGDEIDLMVYTPLPFKLFSSKTQPGEMEVMATFDHELGHLVVKGGFFSQDSTLRESAADAYAVLRHLQRYGEKSEAIDRGGWRRAFDFIFSGDAGHFTTLAVDEVTKLKDKLDLPAMTPQQTAELAGRIALAYTPHADVTNEAAQSFESVRRMLRRTEDLEPALKTLAQVTLAEDASFYTFKIGARCLERFLDGKVMRQNGKTLELRGSFWDDVRDTLKDRLSKLDDEGLLLGMPVKKAGSAPRNAEPPSPVKRDFDLSQKPSREIPLAKPEPPKHHGFWDWLNRRAA